MSNRGATLPSLIQATVHTLRSDEAMDLGRRDGIQPFLPSSPRSEAFVCSDLCRAVCDLSTWRADGSSRNRVHLQDIETDTPNDI